MHELNVFCLPLLYNCTRNGIGVLIRGPEYILTLDTVNNLGGLCTNQGKIVEAEKIYL